MAASFKGAAAQGRDYARGHKSEMTALSASLLLGTTALSSPFLATGAGAAMLMGGALWTLLKTGDMTVNNTLSMGQGLKWSAMTLGVAIGFLNTVPEIAVSMSSVIKGATEIGIGNIVGSNLAHIGLILGGTAAIAGLPKPKDLSWKFNTVAMGGAATLFGAQLAMGSLSPVMGAGMLALGGYYLKQRLSKAQQHDEEVGTCLFHDHGDNGCEHEHDTHEPHDHCEHSHDHNDEEHHDAHQETEKHAPWLSGAFGLAGFAGMTASASLLVDAGTSLANNFNIAAMGVDFGMTQALVGSVIVALGTAMPELTINLKAIKQRNADLAIGNVLGCSIVNTLVAGGLLSMTGASVPEAFTPDTTAGWLNMGAFLGASGLLTATLLKTGGALNRKHGAAALALYASYIGGSFALSDDASQSLHQHTDAEPNKASLIARPHDTGQDIHQDRNFRVPAAAKLL